MAKSRGPTIRRADRADAEAQVVSGIRSYWVDILARMAVGESVAEKRAVRFLAGSPPAGRRQADAYYSVPHARRIAALSDPALAVLVESWLAQVVDYAFEEFEGAERGAYLMGIGQSEYVTISAWHHGGRLIERWPNDNTRYYDDLYERTATGVSIGARLYIYKGSGEPYTPGEIRSVRAGVRDDMESGLLSDGDFGHWRITHEPVDDVRVVVTNIEDTDYFED